MGSDLDSVLIVRARRRPRSGQGRCACDPGEAFRWREGSLGQLSKPYLPDFSLVRERSDTVGIGPGEIGHSETHHRPLFKHQAGGFSSPLSRHLTLDPHSPDNFSSKAITSLVPDALRVTQALTATRSFSFVWAPRYSVQVWLATTRVSAVLSRRIDAPLGVAF